MEGHKINFVSRTKDEQEWFLWLEENGPWSDDAREIKIRLKAMQTRLYDLIETLLEGNVAKPFPQSKGCKFRVVIATTGWPPPAVEKFVVGFDKMLHTHPVVSVEFAPNEFASEVKVVFEDLSYMLSEKLN